MKLPRGRVVIVDPDVVAVGREQTGRRPCVVVGDPSVLPELRFAVIVVAPVTSTLLARPFYPRVQPRSGSGLRNVSTVLVDNIRGVDPARVVGLVGNVSAQELDAIDAALRRLLGG